MAGAVDALPRDARRRRRDRHDPADPPRLEPARGLQCGMRGDVRHGPPRVAAEDHVARPRPRRRRGPDDAVGPGPGRRRPAGDRERDPRRRGSRDPRLQPLDDLRQHCRAQPRRDRLLHPARPRRARGGRRRGSRGSANVVPAVEEFGVEPIPAGLRTVGWRDLFAINFTFFLNPVMYVLGALAVAAGGLPLWWAVAAMVLGQALAFSLLIPVAEVGVDHGLPGQVALRATLGFWGARLLSSPYRVLAATYWFAAQALTSAYGFQAIVQTMTGHRLPLVPVAIGLAVVHAVLAVLGFDVMRYVLRVVLPLSLALTGVLLALYLASDDPRFAVHRVFRSSGQHFTWVGFATYVTVMCGASLTLVANIADVCRYTRSRRDMRIALFGSAVTSAVVTTFVGGYAAAATGESNPFVAVAGLTKADAVLVVI